MRRSKSILLVAALFATVLCATALAAVEDGTDTIHLKGKKPLTGVKVISESATEIVYTKRRSSKRVTVSTDQVLSVSYEVQPADYREAIQLFALGDFVNAASSLKAVSKTPHKGSPWVKVYSLVYLGRARLSLGEYSKAADAYRAALKAQPDTRWRLALARGLVAALGSQGDHGGAEQAVQEFRRAITAHKIPGSAKSFADLLLCEVKLRAGKFNEVSSLASTAAANAVEYPSIAAQVRSLQIQALIQTKDLSRAKSVVQKLDTLARKGNNPSAKAAARNGEAAILLAETADLDQIIHLLARAHVENWEGISEMPRTCYLLGRSYLQAAKAAGSSDAKVLARAYFEETTKRFPESSEAILARDELKKM